MPQVISSASRALPQPHLPRDALQPVICSEFLPWKSLNKFPTVFTQFQKFRISVLLKKLLNRWDLM